jgi:hypothetical protein
MKSEEVFVSKRDRWAGVMFWGIVACTWALGLLAVLDTMSWMGRLGIAAVCLVISGSVLWFWFTTRYVVTPSSLHLRSGPFHSEIPLHSIRAVIASRKGWGLSYALSLRALQIDVEGSQLGYRISPEDRSRFMAAIAERCGHLVAEGEDLTCGRPSRLNIQSRRAGVFEPRQHEYSVPFNGNPADALDVARTALLALGFEIALDSDRELHAEGPGMHSNQQPALVGASSIRFLVTESSVSVVARLGGVATMKTFVYLFPPGLVASLLVMAKFLEPDFSLLHLLWVLLWAGIAPFIGRALERSTNRAIDRLVRSMAQARRSR